VEPTWDPAKDQQLYDSFLFAGALRLGRSGSSYSIHPVQAQSLSCVHDAGDAREFWFAFRGLQSPDIIVVVPDSIPVNMSFQVTAERGGIWVVNIEFNGKWLHA
jgi:hypothetical protein